jgi:ABC-type multidrug transport system, ATPase component
MNHIHIIARNISKTFNRRQIFSDISFSTSAPGSIAITGKNGAGKSTLAKIIAGVLSSTSGEFLIELDGKKLDDESRKTHIGFVSPYLNLYDEFSAMENLFLLMRIRSTHDRMDHKIEPLLKRFSLWERRDDAIRAYSTGMKQRLKYVFALAHSPSVLILDEPTANLDNDGIKVVEYVVTEQKRSSILIVATNDSAEAAWCEESIRL